MLQEEKDGIWQDISYCDQNTINGGTSPLFPYFKPSLYYKYDFSIFGGGSLSSSFATITSYTPLHFRMQILAPNT
ncbi:hypothetical protein J6W20_02350 [bacterium]|nr:hypothetical protein [bacterium]